MKTTYFLILILAVSFPSYLKADDETPPPPLISISGYGEVKVRPDEVEVSIGIQLRDQDVGTLSKLIDKRSSEVIKILRNANVTDEDIETSSVSIQPYYADTSSSYGSTKPDYYIGQKSVTFTLKNISNYDSIMTKLYEAGINRVDSVVFQLSDELLQSKKFEARKKAAANAKEILNTLVDGLGLDIGKPYYVSESSSGGSPQPYYGYDTYSNYASRGAQASDVQVEYEEAEESSSGPSISGGEITLSSTVSAQYYLV